MNGIVKNILGTVIAAAIVADATILWQLSERTARTETKIEQMQISVEKLQTHLEERHAQK
jgi:hypothetical protein